MRGAGRRDDKICSPEIAWNAIKLLAILHKRVNEDGHDIVAELGHFDPDAFRSLLSENSIPQPSYKRRICRAFGAPLEERVIRRHLWVALRKFRYQRDYTFLIEMDEGRLRLRDIDGPVFTNPRLGPAITFLKDIHLIDGQGLTDQGAQAAGLMKLYERFADKSYHTSIATTFGIDFDAYESIVLPRLRGAGCRNNIVIPDGRMLTHALDGASVLPRQAGRLYTVSGVTARGAFHPKCSCNFGRRGGRLILGSANLTASGLAGNLELVGMIACGNEDSGEQRLIAGAWNYLSRLIDGAQQALIGQRDWMLARTPWLRRANPEASPVQLGDQTVAALLTSGESTGIGGRFAALINEPVSRLIIVSPYWDMTLTALSHLIERLAPSETALLLDPNVVAFPKDALDSLPNVRLYRRGEFAKGRFIHAKAIIAQSPNADHVLIGSANCTLSALGNAGFAGDNEEVCLYRRLPPDSILDALGLAEALANDRIIDVASLEEPVLDEELPLDKLAARMPGQFECKVDVLSWRPPMTADPETSTIELLKQSGQPLICQLAAISRHPDRCRYQITGTDELPSFARLLFPDGSHSAPAIITLIDRLRAAIREGRVSDLVEIPLRRAPSIGIWA